MPDELLVELATPWVRLTAGGAPQQVALTIHNASADRESYSVEVTGLDSDWITPPPPTVILFPGDTDRPVLTLRPPRRATRGKYAYRVLVSARSGVQTSAEGTLEIGAPPDYRMDLPTLHETGRGDGNFPVRVANTGGEDIDLVLSAQPSTANCTVRFGRSSALHLAPEQVTSVPLSVRPKKKPLVGEPRNYDFTVTAQPDDVRLAPQTRSGTYTHEPRFPSWDPVRRAFLIIGAIVLALVLIAVVIPANAEGPLGALRSGACSIPIVGEICPTPGPAMAAACTFSEGFQAYAQTEPKLIGACVTPALDDGFGNVRQYTREGVLFWSKQANAIYFFKGDSLYAFLDDKSTLIHGSGRS